MTLERPVIAFDLDGTLVDTAPDLLDTLDVVLKEHGVTPIDREETRKLIGTGARSLIQRSLSRIGVVPSDAELAQLNARFLEHYAAHIADRSVPFAGLDGALDALEAEGARFAVCTNKLERLARLLLDGLDLSRRFEVITGADTYARPKPDPLPLISTIEAAGGRVPYAIMVGDSATDVATAKAAGVPCVAVSFGYTETPAAELGADHLIHHFDDLHGAVRELLRRQG